MKRPKTEYGALEASHSVSMERGPGSSNSVSPVSKFGRKTDSNLCPFFDRLLELFKWATPSKSHNLKKSFPRPPANPTEIPKDYDERQELIKILAAEKRELRHHILKVLFSCLQQIVPKAHASQIALVLKSQDAFLTLFDHEAVTDEPRDGLLLDQTIALRIFVKMLPTPKSVKQFLSKVVELPLRSQLKGNRREHSSYAHFNCNGDITKTEGCTLIERIYDIFLHPHPDHDPNDIDLFRLAAVDFMLYVQDLNCVEVLLKRRNLRAENDILEDCIPFIPDLILHFLKLFNKLYKERMGGMVVYKSESRRLCTALFQVIVSLSPRFPPGTLKSQYVRLKAMLTRLYLWSKGGKGWQMPERFTNDADILQALINHDTRAE